jgi:hypothetical protein
LSLGFVQYRSQRKEKAETQPNARPHKPQRNRVT